MGTIFRHAASCEGGSLQSRNGPTTPENYLRRWRKALAAPVAMPDVQVTLRVGNNWRTELAPEKALAAHHLLEQAGRPELAVALSDGPVLLTLHRDIDCLVALCSGEGEQRILQLWQLLSYDEAGTTASTELAPPRRAGDVYPPHAAANRSTPTTWWCATTAARGISPAGTTAPSATT